MLLRGELVWFEHEGQALRGVVVNADPYPIGDGPDAFVGVNVDGAIYGVLPRVLHRVAEEIALRDRFAMAALTGIIGRGHVTERDDAIEAYIYADAMLRERAQEPRA